MSLVFLSIKGKKLVAFNVSILKACRLFRSFQWCLMMYYFSSKKLDTEPLELFEIAVKELTFDQLQLLKVLLLWLDMLCVKFQIVYEAKGWVFFFGVTIDSLAEHILKIVLVEQVANAKNITFAPYLSKFYYLYF